MCKYILINFDPDYYKTPELEKECAMPCRNTKLYVSLKGSDPKPGILDIRWLNIHSGL